MPALHVLRLKDKEGYGIDPVDLYRNSRECQERFPGVAEPPDVLFERDSTSRLPVCFFTLPVRPAKERPHGVEGFFSRLRDDIKDIYHSFFDDWGL